MDDFEYQPEHRLARYSDLELMAYINRAHAADAMNAVQLAFTLLHYRHLPYVQSMLGELPADRVEDVTQEVFLVVHKAAITGKNIDKFSHWLARVTKNHQANFWRGPQGKQLKQERDGASLDDEDTWLQPSHADEYGGADAGMLVDSVLAKRNPQHQEIVRRYVLDGFSAKEVADQLGHSEAKVFKVAQRFRDDLRALIRGEDLDDADDDPGADRGDRI